MNRSKESSFWHLFHHRVTSSCGRFSTTLNLSRDHCCVTPKPFAGLVCCSWCDFPGCHFASKTILAFFQQNIAPPQQHQQHPEWPPVLFRNSPSPTRKMALPPTVFFLLFTFSPLQPSHHRPLLAIQTTSPSSKVLS